MFKKIIIINLLFLFTTTALAYTDESGNTDETLAKFKSSKVLAEPQDLGGYIDTQKYHEEVVIQPFYIGLSGGINMDYINYNHTPPSSSTEKDRLSTLGPYGTITLGYGAKVDIFYLGAAIDGSINWAESKQSFPGTYRKMEIPYSLGAYFIPGIFMTDNTIFYLKIGGAYSEFKLSTNNPTYYKESSFSKNIWGGRGGLGIRYYFNKYFSINGEYIFTYYQDAKNTYQNHKTKYSPLTSQFNLGLAVHF
jgi:opacity protein-like surface antigen